MLLQIFLNRSRNLFANKRRQLFESGPANSPDTPKVPKQPPLALCSDAGDVIQF
jgi:hypothetical protein